MRSLKEVIAFNAQYADRELAYFGQDLFVKAEKKGPLTDKAYQDALAKNHRLTRERGNRRGDGEVSSRCAGRADCRTVLAD